MNLFELLDVNYGIKAGHPGAMFTVGDVYGTKNLNVPHARLNVQAKNKRKLGIPESVTKENEEQFISALRDLFPIALQQLKLKKLPKIKLEKYVDHADQPTFGRFVNDTETIHLGIENRHVIDILRTLAHELVHYKQYELGELGPESGRTGSPAENEAHAVAGIIMRHFNLNHPEYFHDPAISLDEAAKVRLSTDPNNFGAYVSDTGDHEEKTVKIPVHKIDVFEPDAKFDEPKYAKNLKKIVNAIKAGKTLPPILVRRMPGLRYQVLDGHHRFKAYRLAGVKFIPARIVAPANVKVDEIKQRLDPKCWKGKHKEGTKIKGGVRVNNCVPNEGIEENTTADGISNMFGNAFDPVVSNLQRVALLAMQGRQSEAASRLRTVIKSASPEAQQKITDAVNNIKPVTINGKVADSSTLEKSKEHNEWILKTFIPWVKNILSKHTVSEAPKDYDSMNLNSEDKQKSLDYFYNDHAPKFGKPKLAGRLGNYQVVNFVKDKLTLMFLVDQKEQPAFYVAFKKRPDGVAIGNVRSNGSIRATEVYKYLIDQYKTLYSDKVQTPDGRKIWANLARTYPELEITDVGTRLMARAKSNSVSEAGSPAQQAAIAIAMKKAGKKPKKTREDVNGPESKPTMPAGTVRVDVSDVYDWYKLGQHISNMKGLGNHDFGKGPPSTIISFGSEEEEHKYLKDLEKLGLPTTDIDPIDLKQPKGMKRQKVDPTYNVNEDDNDAEIHNYEKLDKILSGLCQMVTDGQESEKDYGMVAAAVLDPDNRMVARLNRPGKNGKRIHAEHAAIIGYTKQHGDIPEGSIILTTLSPCNEAMDERDGPSCTDLINGTVVKKVYCGYIDPTQDNDTRQFNLMETGDKQIRIQCKEFADTFLDHVHEDLDEDVGGNYLYHATSADGLKSILQSGNIKAARGPQDATKAQTKMPSVSVSRDWGYASGSHARAQSQGGIGRDAVLILNRNAVENNFRTLGTSQSGDVRGAAYATAQKIRQYKLGSKSHFDDPEIEDEFNTIYRASKAGGEFEEAVVVPKGSLPIKNSLVGFWVNPKSELADDPAIMDDPRRLELAPGGTGRFVKASQQKDVTEGLEKDYLSQVSNLSWKPVNRSVWNTIQDEGLDEEQDAPNHTDWVMASLTIDPKDAQALQAFDNDAVEDFNRFDIQLKDRYPGLTDLIDYDRGTVTIVKPINQGIDENFADGKNPQDKGDSKRYGVPTKASISTLRKFAKSHSGRAAQLAHWAANMKSGKRK